MSFQCIARHLHLSEHGRLRNTELTTGFSLDVHHCEDSVGRVHVPQETVVRDVTAFENALKAPKARKVPVPVSVPVPVPVFGRFLGK